ncbi:MAG: hypothetical protein PWQ55_1241 [Chloroflexota bacterium]|nr:hypothetical protein [Chloroflexota bacterium]
MAEMNPFPEFEQKIAAALRTPAAHPDFVARTRADLLRRPARPRFRLGWRPVWALLLLLLALLLIFSQPRLVEAMRRLFGYLPGVGLVENDAQMRVLAQPVSQAREGITLTIEHVLVFDERVELVYHVDGIDPADDGYEADDYVDDPTAFCGGVNVGEVATHEGDPLLQLPDGTLLERAPTGSYEQNVFAMKPVFDAVVPADVMEMTFRLQCIPMARKGAVPENWEIPFQLTRLPEGEIVGYPVKEVGAAQGSAAQAKDEITDGTQDEEPASAAGPEADQPALPVHHIALHLEKTAKAGDTAVFYISMDAQDANPALLSIIPNQIYIVDSQGQRIQLIPSGPWQPYTYQPGSLFELIARTRPADGPLSLVVEDATLHYMPLYVDPPQAAPQDYTFSFDVGPEPQAGQSWPLDVQFSIGGYPFRITSVRAVRWEDVAEPSYIVGSQGYEYGYQFAIEGDPRVKMSLSLDLSSEACALWVVKPTLPEGAHILYTELCREAFPAAEVRATVRELSVLVEDTWQTTLEWQN